MRAEGSELFELKENEVHFWTLHISDYLQFTTYLSILSEDEVRRANKFRFKSDKDTYILGRVALRTLLGKYLDIYPSKIDFTYNEQGKPNVVNSKEINFNLSNSASMIAIAICKGSPVGIDVEYNKRAIEIEEIAPKFFSKKEVQKLQKVSTSGRLDAFYHCWTRKEAFIKALGGGLTIPLDEFEVSFLEDEEPSLLEIAWNQDSPDQWKMHSFSIGLDYSAAIIVENSNAYFSEKTFQSEWLYNEVIQ